MRKVLPLALVLGVAGIGFGILAALGGGGYRLAEAAPEGTVVWVEAMDVKGALAAFRQSASHADYQRSTTRAKLEAAWKDAAALGESEGFAAWKAIGLQPDEESLLLGLGQNVGLGAVVTGDAPPSVFAATRLDVVGLAKRVAVQGDWTQVWAKLRDALGGADAAKETYEGYELVTRQMNGQGLTCALLQDVLVASPDLATVKLLVDVKRGKRPSLGKQAAFKAELDAFEDAPLAYAWVDLALLRDNARLVPAVKAAGERLGMGEALAAWEGKELAVLQRDLAPRGGLAWGLFLPKGEVYQARVRASRERGELFVDAAEHDLRALLSEETAIYGEARGLWGALTGFAGSETCAALSRTEAATWVKAQLADPKRMNELLPPGASPVPLEGDPTFELRLALAALRLPLEELIGNDVAMALEVRLPPQGAPPPERPQDALRGVTFVRARPLLRAAVDVFSGLVAAEVAKGSEQGKQAVVAEHGGRTIYGVVKEPQPLYWTQLGAELALASNREALERLIDAASKPAAPPGGFTSTLTRLPQDYRFFVYYDLQRYMQAVQGLAPMGEKEAKALESMQGAMGPMALAGYVSQDWATWSLRAYQAFGPGAPPELKALYLNADPEPAAWSRLPDGTFLSTAAGLDARMGWAWAMSLVKAMGAEEDFKQVLAQVEKDLLGGKQVEQDLIAHLGREFGFGLRVQDVAPPEGAKAGELVAIPGALLAVQLADEAQFKAGFLAVLRAAVDQVNQEKMRGRSAVVPRALDEIHSAQEQFREGDMDGDGELDYGTLPELIRAGLLSPELAEGGLQGYTFEVRPAGQSERWMASASPAEPGPGRPAYFMNQTGVIHEVDGPLPPPTPECEPPEGAVPHGSRPVAAPKPDPKDPEMLGLATKKLGEVEVQCLVLPEREREQFKSMIGDGLTPCAAFSSGWLLIASSEATLQAALAAKKEQGSLASSPAFQAVTKGAPRQVAAFGHLTWSGIGDQVGKNAELLARKAAPLPADMAAPTAPEFPADVEGEAAEKAFQAWQAEMEKYQAAMEAQEGKASAWREAHAAENAASLKRLLGSLAALGSLRGWHVVDKDGAGVESVQEVRLDPGAASR